MKTLKLIVLVAFIVVPALLMAQPPDPPGGGAPPCGPPFGPACIPIDGGIGFLIAAGVALGGKKAYDMARAKNK